VPQNIHTFSQPIIAWALEDSTTLSDKSHSTNLFWFIDLIPQLPRTLKRHHPPRSQHHIFTGCWIPAPSFSLLLDAEFPEPADQHILTGSQLGPYQINQGFDEFSRLVSRESVSLSYRFDKVGPGGGHRWGSFWLNVISSSKERKNVSAYCNLVVFVKQI
jgi:hypothetical protein